MESKIAPLPPPRLGLSRSYNPNRNSISNPDSWNSLIDEYIETYDNFLFIGDFNISM